MRLAHTEIGSCPGPACERPGRARSEPTCRSDFIPSGRQQREQERTHHSRAYYAPKLVRRVPHTNKLFLLTQYLTIGMDLVLAVPLRAP